MQACGNYTEQGEVITTMTEVADYNLHILLCYYCNYSSIAENLIQGATEVDPDIFTV